MQNKRDKQKRPESQPLTKESFLQILRKVTRTVRKEEKDDKEKPQ